MRVKDDVMIFGLSSWRWERKDWGRSEWERGLRDELSLTHPSGGHVEMPRRQWNWQSGWRYEHRAVSTRLVCTADKLMRQREHGAEGALSRREHERGASRADRPVSGEESQ